MPVTNRTYYTAVEQHGSYRGQVYRYRPDGNTADVLWTSDTRYDTSEQALDAAAQWLEDNGVEAELD
jgi:Zn-dependent metalloprotease